MTGELETGHISESDIVKRAVAGDAGAFRELYYFYAPQMLAFVAARVPRRLDAEGVAQEVWLRAWRSLQQFDGRHFRGWLYTIARNLLLDTYRKKSESLLPATFDIAEARLDTEDERLGALRECLSELGDTFMAVLQARLSGSSVDDIADRFSIETATVYTRVNRGKERLENCIKTKMNVP